MFFEPRVFVEFPQKLKTDFLLILFNMNMDDWSAFRKLNILFLRTRHIVVISCGYDMRSSTGNWYCLKGELGKGHGKIWIQLELVMKRKGEKKLEIGNEEMILNPYLQHSQFWDSYYWLANKYYLLSSLVVGPGQGVPRQAAVRAQVRLQHPDTLGHCLSGER